MNPTPPGTLGRLSRDAFSTLFQAIDGLRNRRALIAMLGCLVAGVLVAGVFSLAAARLGVFVGFLGGLLLFVAAATGINAAGVLLMDQARGVPPRPLIDAVVYGLMCIPKFIVLGLALLLVAIAVFLVLAIVYGLCKLPVLGPVLFVVAFPLSVVVSGVTLCGLAVCMLLALPAIWEGATITRAIAQTLAITRSRLVEALMLLVVAGLFAGLVGFIVFSVLFSGMMPAIALSAAIIGGDDLYAMLGLMREGAVDLGVGDPYGAAAAGGYAIAAGIGAGLLWALAGSLVSLVYLLGLNLVYRRVTEGLDVGAAETELQARFDSAKRQAADLGQRAKDAAERAREQARQSAAAAQASANAAAAAMSRPRAAEAAPDAATAPTAAPIAPPNAARTAAPVTTPQGPATMPTPRDLPPGSTTPAVAAVLTCPQCLSAIGKDDVFCGVCGFRQK
jgi:hypothetical protein